MPSHKYKYNPIFLLCIFIVHGTYATRHHRSLDVSYQYQFNFNSKDDILEKVHEVLNSPSKDNYDEDEDTIDNDKYEEVVVLDVDASSSNLGDEGVIELVNVLFEKSRSSSNGSGGVPFRLGYFGLSMNQLSKVSICHLVDCLVESCSVCAYNNSYVKEDDKVGPGPLDQSLRPSLNETRTEGGMELMEVEVNVTKDTEAKKVSDVEICGDEVVPTTDEYHINSTDLISCTTGLSTNENVYEGMSIDCLDLSFNNFGSDREITRSLQKLIEFSYVQSDGDGDGARVASPNVLHLEYCGLGPPACRIIGKGLFNRKFKTVSEIHLTGNPVGDVGAAALANAIKDSIRSIRNSTDLSIHVLNLSSCQIGDAGAEAFSSVFDESTKNSIMHLNLNFNDISDTGASAVGRAFVSSAITRKKQSFHSSLVLEKLEMSGNKYISDAGARELAEAVKHGCLKCLHLRSCSIRSEGISSFGDAIKHYLYSSGQSNQIDYVTEIDLSGNQLGMAKPKVKKSIFSAKAATESASNAFSFIGKTIKSGLKDYAGIDVNDVMGNDSSYVESDDEVESNMKLEDGYTAQTRCGIRMFADVIIDEIERREKIDEGNSSFVEFTFRIGLRQCFVDQAGADALAALVVKSKGSGLKFTFDLSMNDDLLDNNIIQEFSDGPTVNSEEFQEWAQRHVSLLEKIRLSKERAMEATNLRSNHYNDDDDILGTIWEDSETEYRSENTYDSCYDPYDAYDDYLYD